MSSKYSITYTHADQDQHIRAAAKVGREPNSRPDPNTSIWDFGLGDAGQLRAQQVEARLRGDLPEITYGKHAAEVSSGGLPKGGTASAG